MSNNIRIVKYNEGLFKIPSGTKKRKKPDKPIKLKTEKKVSNKTIKNRILNEIRKNQEKQYNSLLVESNPKINNFENDFENDFKNSVDFMKKMADKHKETKLNETIKNHNAKVEENVIQNANLSNSNLIPVYLDEKIIEYIPVVAPNYGCMKNGNLPTYRAYHNKTLKSQHTIPMNPMVPPMGLPMVPPMVLPMVPSMVPSMVPPMVPPMVLPMTQSLTTERIKSPAELLLIQKLKQREHEIKNPKKKQKKYKKLLRRTYRIGKDKYKPKIGVLLPNKTIRSDVTTKSYILKQTPIDEIKKTLVKQGFIKVGSSAPNDVLRKIYESIQMIGGDINNHNPDNLLYNFFNEKNKYS